MADKIDIAPRKLTGRLQVELLEIAATRIDDESISPVLRRWADSILEDISIFDLAFICDCDIDQLMDYSPNQLQDLATAAKKANPHFFGMIDRERKQQQDMMDRFPDMTRRLIEGQLSKQSSSSE